MSNFYKHRQKGWWLVYILKKNKVINDKEEHQLPMFFIKNKVMKKKTDFEKLIEMCERIGWNTGMAQLEKMVLDNERLQADLFAGDYKQQGQARKLSRQIIEQNIIIWKLKEYRKNHGL